MDQGNTRVTVDNNLIVARSFFSWCKSRGLIALNPVSQQRHGVKLFFDEAPVRKETYARGEYAKILAAADVALKRVCRFLANSGMRISELAMLEWTDIDLGGKWMHVRVKITHDGIEYRPKDDTDRKISINPDAEAVLNELGAATGRRGYVLPLPTVKLRIDYAERTYLGKLKLLETATGIDKKKLTLHSFRRFFVSECAEHGIPMATVMDWVGHDEMKMVMYYYSLRDESAQRAMEGFSAGRTDSQAPPVETATGAGQATESRSDNPQDSSDEAPRKRSRRGIAVPRAGWKPRTTTSRCGRIDRHRTSPDTLDRLGSKPSRSPLERKKQRKTERGGLDKALFCKLAKALYLRLKPCSNKDFSRLVDVLFLHDFLPSRDAF